MKTVAKEEAITLRQRGFSYSEILKEVPVAKSTLSLWLRSVGLSKPQKQRLTEKKLAAALRGGEAKRRQRILLTQKIQEQAIRDVKKISERELWLMGIMLYWAEGSKEREGNIGLGVHFSNSDAQMTKIFLKWLIEICKVPKQDIFLEIYIHENSKNNLEKVINHWSTITGFPRHCFSRIYFKQHKVSTNRKNTGDSYHGLLRVGVKASSSLNRKIAGWIKGVIEYLEVNP